MSKGVPAKSLVLEYPAAEPAEASSFFQKILSMTTDPADLWEDLQKGVRDIVVIDVRAKELYETTHIPGAVNLPHRSITADTTADLDRTKTYVVYCNGNFCNGSLKGALALSALGFKVKELMAGLRGWQVHDGFPVHSATDEGADSARRCGC